MKKLFSCLVALVALFSISSCLQEERSPEEILVPSPAQVDCSESSFSLTSKVPSGSEKLVDACGFLVGTTKDLADAVTVEGTLNANTFAADLPSRKYGTTYYICSYVTNGHGSEIKSQVSSFEMGDFDDYVSFGKVSLVSYNPLTKLAEINIPVEILSVVNVTEVGVCYGADESLSIDGTHAEGVISEDGILSVPLEGFTDGIQYYLRPYVSENDYIAYGKAVSFVIPSVPIVLTYPAEDVTSDSALLSGEVQRGEGITERGFVWLSGQGVPTIDSYKVKVDGTVGKFTASLNDLEAGGRFAYRAYVINNQGVFYGDILNFTTIAGLPSLSAMKVSDITMTSASFTCTVTSYGGDPVSEVGFYIGKEESVDIETALRISEAYTSDSFTLTATDLEVGTDYYVKAFTKNSVGESYSVIVSFKTVSTAPSVTTVGSSEITNSSVLLSGDVTDDNGEDITERGFVWLKGTGTPTTSNSKLRSDGTTGEYSATLSDLEPNQTYSYRSYAVNAKGTAYGESMTFRTKVALPEVVFVSCSDVTSSSAIVSGKVTSHGGETVSEVGFLYGTTSNLDFATSSKVTATYAGASFSFTLTSLTSVAEYYVQPFAKNSAGTAYGEVVSFTTLPDSPIAPSQISYTVVGTLNNINWDNAAAEGLMTYDGTYHVARNVPFVWASTLYGGAKQIEFKILETGTWDGFGVAPGTGVQAANAEIAVVAVVAGGDNICVAAAEGAYDVYLDAANGKVWVMTPGYKPGQKPGSEAPSALYTEWLFTADAMSAYADTFGGTEGTASKEAGDGGMYVAANVAGEGKISYVQIDKTELDADGKATRNVGGTGHPYVTGIWPGDYWLFEATDGTVYPAGTSVNISYITRTSKTGHKYWRLEYLDGEEWKPAMDVTDYTLNGEEIQYNIAMFGDGKTNVEVNATVTYSSPVKDVKFRMVCAGNGLSSNENPAEKPNGGTGRIAGTEGTSPIIMVLLQ